MAWSKSTRIGVMLGIDIAFFLLELISGFIVGSLALTADAFHMLNDIISLLVGLWAVRVARRESSDRYSYGWVRAEIVGAFFNAVFLIALCVSIILEAVTRLFDPPEIQSPQLILIVGSLGLASNLVGFLVLGGHGHSHGSEDEGAGHSHDHSHGEHDHVHEAEEGRNEAYHYNEATDITDEDGRVADILPEALVARASHPAPPSEQQRHAARFPRRDGTPDAVEHSGSRVSVQSAAGGSTAGGGGGAAGSRGRESRRRTSSMRHSRGLTSIEDLNIHPASFRQEIIAASRPQIEELSSSDSERDSTVCDEPDALESTPLLKDGASADEGGANGNGHGHGHAHSRHNSGNGNGKDHDHDDHTASSADNGTNGGGMAAPPPSSIPADHSGHDHPHTGPQGVHAHGHSHSHRRSGSSRLAGGARPRTDSALHKAHNHNKPKCKEMRSKGSGHSHGDMGMNAMVLHVLGDALGNLGVIVTALVIWLTSWPGRYYADPAVSLLIAAIILRSALPLTLATSKILLQATPDHIDVSLIKEDIQALPGVISCHHVHIWQLSDTKIVASLHVQVSFPIGAGGGERYMELARRCRRCLHAYGIHSATIQPEFCLNREHDHGEDASLTLDGSPDRLTLAAKKALLLAARPPTSTPRSGVSGPAHHPEFPSGESTALNADGSADTEEGHGHGHDYDHDNDHDHGDVGVLPPTSDPASQPLVAQAAADGVRRRVRFPPCGRTQDNGDLCLLEECVDNCTGMGCCSVGGDGAASPSSSTGSGRKGGHGHAH